MREKQQSALVQFLPDGGTLLIMATTFPQWLAELSNSVVGVKNKLRKCPVWGAIFCAHSALKVRTQIIADYDRAS
jgi:hypothetical protein